MSVFRIELEVKGEGNLDKVLSLVQDEIKAIKVTRKGSRKNILGLKREEVRESAVDQVIKAVTKAGGRITWSELNTRLCKKLSRPTVLSATRRALKRGLIVVSTGYGYLELSGEKL